MKLIMESESLATYGYPSRIEVSVDGDSQVRLIETVAYMSAIMGGMSPEMVRERFTVESDDDTWLASEGGR